LFRIHTLWLDKVDSTFVAPLTSGTLFPFANGFSVVVSFRHGKLALEIFSRGFFEDLTLRDFPLPDLFHKPPPQPFFVAWIGTLFFSSRAKHPFKKTFRAVPAF